MSCKTITQRECVAWSYDGCREYIDHVYTECDELDTTSADLPIWSPTTSFGLTDTGFTNAFAGPVPEPLPETSGSGGGQTTARPKIPLPEPKPKPYKIPEISKWQRLLFTLEGLVKLAKEGWKLIEKSIPTRGQLAMEALRVTDTASDDVLRGQDELAKTWASRNSAALSTMFATKRQSYLDSLEEVIVQPAIIDEVATKPIYQPFQDLEFQTWPNESSFPIPSLTPSISTETISTIQSLQQLEVEPVSTSKKKRSTYVAGWPSSKTATDLQDFTALDLDQLLQSNIDDPTNAVIDLPEPSVSEAGAMCPPCKCNADAPTKQKPKEKKKRKPRTVCYKGTYIERSKGLVKKRQEIVQCQ